MDLFLVWLFMVFMFGMFFCFLSHIENLIIGLTKRVDAVLEILKEERGKK